MKQRPCDLNQKLKRLQASRDSLTLNSRKKALVNKNLQDRNVELTENRNHWKARSKELVHQKEELEQQLQAAKEGNRARTDTCNAERERANKLQAEIESIWEKKITSLKI